MSDFHGRILNCYRQTVEMGANTGTHQKKRISEAEEDYQESTAKKVKTIQQIGTNEGIFGGLGFTASLLGGLIPGAAPVAKIAEQLFPWLKSMLNVTPNKRQTELNDRTSFILSQKLAKLNEERQRESQKIEELNRQMCDMRSKEVQMTDKINQPN